MGDLFFSILSGFQGAKFKRWAPIMLMVRGIVQQQEEDVDPHFFSPDSFMLTHFMSLIHDYQAMGTSEKKGT